MNKHQEAYNIIFDELIPIPELNEIDKKRLFDSMDLLQELVDQTKTPTLEEVKKEWEELGYFETEKGSKYSVIRNEELNKEFTIYHNDKTYDCTKAHFKDITIKEHNLLTKTFRALGWFDE